MSAVVCVLGFRTQAFPLESRVTSNVTGAPSWPPFNYYPKLDPCVNLCLACLLVALEGLISRESPVSVGSATVVLPEAITKGTIGHAPQGYADPSLTSTYHPLSSPPDRKLQSPLTSQFQPPPTPWPCLQSTGRPEVRSPFVLRSA